MAEAIFERPVKATLIVRTEHGEEWQATEVDLKRFGFTAPRLAYERWRRWLLATLGAPELPDDSPLNAIRYSVECALLYDHMPGDSDEEGDRELLDEVRALAAIPAPPTSPEAPE